MLDKIGICAYNPCIFRAKEAFPMKKVFIDGSAGTTGLKIYQRLGERKDIELMILSEELRKDVSARRDMLNKCDIAFLCLPDAAAVEAVSLIENDNTVVIDTSTAHRTKEGWTYGFPELKGQREKIKAAKRVANPGCHASGFIALVTPLLQAGIIPKDALLSCFSLTGYSGGGKKMIAEYEGADRCPLLDAPRQYGLSQGHKHLPEMKKLSGLDIAPLFSPIVASYFAGMEVTVPLHKAQINGTMQEISDVYAGYYTDGVVSFNPSADESGFLSANRFEGKDSMEVTVSGNEDRILLTARYDNLGKGASGAAIQSMNIILGVDEKQSLVL